MPQLAACESPQLSRALKTPQFLLKRAHKTASVSATHGSPIGASELSGCSTSACPLSGGSPPLPAAPPLPPPAIPPAPAVPAPPPLPPLPAVPPAPTVDVVDVVV